MAVVFVVALAVRAALWLAALPEPSRLLSPPDSAEYVAIAQNIAAGHGFSADPSPPYRPDLRRTPLYPSVLAGLFLLPYGGVRLAALAGVLASAATVAGMCWIASRLFGRGAALVGAVLLAIDVTSVSFSVLILTEAFFTALLVAAVIVLLKKPMGSAVGARGGLLLGCAALCRPAGVLLAPASLPVCAWQRSGRRAVLRDYLWVNAVFALIVLGWMGRNVVVAGIPTLSSIWSVNLYFHRAAAVEARLEGLDVEEVRTRWERQFESMSTHWSEEAKLAWMTQHARDVIAAHPLTYVFITIDGFAHMMRSDTTELCQVLGLQRGSAGFRAASVVASVQLWLMYPAALIGLLAASRDAERRRAALIPLTLIAYFILVSGPEAYARFRVPAMPFLAILSGFGIDRVASLSYQRFLTRAKIRSYLPNTTSHR